MNKKELRPEDMLRNGIIVSSIGLALLLGLQLTIGIRPWHTTGFIPIFVWIALIIPYYIIRK